MAGVAMAEAAKRVARAALGGILIRLAETTKGVRLLCSWRSVHVILVFSDEEAEFVTSALLFCCRP